MSHGQPPPGQQPPGMQNDMYGFGQMAMPQMGGPVMSNDPADMMFMETFIYDPSMVMGGIDNQDDSGMASSAYNTNPNPTSPQHTSTGALGQMGGPSGMELQQYQPSIGEENKPGAGPPPMSAVGFQAPALAAGSSQLTEFTKRRNWPAKCIEELKDLMIILDLHMRIKYVAPSVNDLTGYTADELHEKVLRELLHPDDQPVFLTDFNECIATGRKLRLFFRLRKKDGSFSIFESVGHAHIAAARFAPAPNNQSPFCQAVYMMARLYPATNAKLLDSFLEHKLEHERLLRRINELKKEEAEDVEEANRSWRQSQSDITPSEDTGITPLTNLTGSAYRNADAAAMPPPERPNPHKSALTRENLESAVTGNRPDSIRDKMARYDQYSSAANHIEMLTGLRYNDGERARGITTGSHSPTLIKGDAGIAIPIDRDPRTGDKKKKQKVAEEYVCTDCGTLDSPEWRKGPSGPKTLCNACGLRWAKREKKRGQSGTGNSGSGATAMTGSGAPGGLMPMMDQGPG